MCFQCMVPLSQTSTTQTYSICYSGLYELSCIMLCKYNLICGSVCTTSSLNSHTETHKPLRSKRHPTHLEFLKLIFLFGGCFQTRSSDLWRFLRGRTCLVAVATLAYGSWECSSMGHEEMNTPHRPANVREASCRAARDPVTPAALTGCSEVRRHAFSTRWSRNENESGRNRKKLSKTLFIDEAKTHA